MPSEDAILVVEDSRLQARRLRDFLISHGFEVMVAYNGLEGIERAREHRPGLVLADLIMPVMDGFEMTRTMREDAALKNVPLIMLTSLSNPEDILRGLEAGADGYIGKPFDEGTLLARIRSTMSHRSAEDGGNSGRALMVTKGSKRFEIKAGRERILWFLLSTYQDMVRQNVKLRETRTKLVALNEQLERLVAQRTADLEAEIAERKKAQAELAEQARELARSNADLEQFAYAASHDLQEPLRVVAGCTQLLQRRYAGKLDGDADEFIGHAVGSVVRMRALIDDLLSYSRVGTRGKALVPADCNEIVHDVLADLREAIEESDAHIDATGLPTVYGDPTQLGQLFRNLVGNAVKFRRDEAPRIDISAEKRDGCWQFAVADNGIGMEKDHLQYIFEVFHRLHTEEEYAGTGIGLAICKKIVERHGGEIWVESRPGEGSVFYFTIPAVPDEEVSGR